MTAKSKALFLDRDGTIIRDVHYIADPGQIDFLPGAKEGMKRFEKAGCKLVIVSNQSGIGRALISREQAEAVQNRVLTDLLKAGVTVAASYFCPHAPEDRCLCRKPLPGMLNQAASDLRLDLAESILVGDKMSDVEAGAAAGCRTVLLNRKPGDADSAIGVRPDFLCDDWQAICSALLS